MKGLARFGEYFWEFLVVTLIAAVSAVTVLPFVPVTVGLCAFFRRGIDERRFKDIFTTIGANWKIKNAITEMISETTIAMSSAFFTRR